MTVATDPDLAIRAAPRPVRRFSRKALAILLGSGSLLILASAGIAMSPKGQGGGERPRELYSTTSKPAAEGLATLPASYSGVRTPPELGPPLPGDLGPPILSAEREGRLLLEEGSVTGPAPVGAASPAADREAEIRASGLFFKTGTARLPAAQMQSAQAYSPSATADPFAALVVPVGPAGRGAMPDDPNRQQHKVDFLAGVSDPSIYNPHRLEEPVSPYQVMAGTMIPAVLVTGVNSDLPGQVIGQVTEPVYDTVTGRYLLIPQGAKLIGRYDSVIAYGQSRALIVWSRIILPDGSSIRIENLPAADAAGYAGLTDRVNNHTLRLFTAAALSSLISVGAELSDEDDRIARALRDAVQDGASRAGNEVLRRQLSVQPTITIRPGWRLRVIVHQDLVLRPYGDLP